MSHTENSVLDERTVPHRNYFHRDVFVARVRHEIMTETHVLVGDHMPEARVSVRNRTCTEPA